MKNFTMPVSMADIIIMYTTIQNMILIILKGSIYAPNAARKSAECDISTALALKTMTFTSGTDHTEV